MKNRIKEKIKILEENTRICLQFFDKYYLNIEVDIRYFADTIRQNRAFIKILKNLLREGK